MKIVKAIEILENCTNANSFIKGSDLYDSVQLGIEALKERAEAVRQGLPLWHELLPGETPIAELRKHRMESPTIRRGG